jgi:hypothetical protein
MTDHKASRTLVKSAPELWAECSDATSLTRHLGAFGEIRITRLEPETAVAWEGDAVSGTVRLEPSGWGTRVILSATAAAPEAVDAQPADPVEPAAVEAVEAVEGEPEAQPEVEIAAEIEPEAKDAEPEAGEVEPEADEVEPEADEVEAHESPDTAKVGALGRLLMRLGLRRRPEPEMIDVGDETELLPEFAATPEPAQTPQTQPTPPESPADPEPLRRRARPGRPAARSEAVAALDAALDSLGRAHHRPYSRS